MICDTVRGVVGERARVAAVGADRFHPFGPVGAPIELYSGPVSVDGGDSLPGRIVADLVIWRLTRHLAHRRGCAVAVTAGTDCVSRCRTSTRADKNAPISIAAKAVRPAPEIRNALSSAGL